jgi:hypothetical protein
MRKFSGLHRHGAIYQWRRRVRAQAGGARRTHLAISLRTPILARARLVAAELNVLAERHAEQLRGADPTEVNIALAQHSYFRAMSQASAISAREQREGPIADASRAEAILQDAAREAARHRGAQAVPSIPAVCPAQGAAHVWTTEDIVVLGEELIAQAAADENWDDKLQRQNRQTYNLLARFVREERGVCGLVGLQQADVAAFANFLRHEVYRHYGKSEKDGHLSIAQLRRQAEDKQKTANDAENAFADEKARSATRGDRRGSKDRERVVGLEGTTLNRHLTGLSQLLAYAANCGVPIASDIDLRKRERRTGLRQRKDCNSR